MTTAPPLSFSELARLVELTEAEAYTDLARAAPPDLGVRAEEVDGATTIVAPTLDVPLFNRIVGLGLAEPMTEESLDRGIATFRHLGVANFAIQLSRAAEPRIAAVWLDERQLAVSTTELHATEMNRRRFISVTAETIVAGSLAGCGLRQRGSTAGVAGHPRPSTSQLVWQRDEVALFLHFGVNTFTDREWGDGRESPAIFSPSNLDARQWARTAWAAGAKAAVLTAKHHDGFCLWPTATTQHSVAQSPWRSGSGDVVREFVDACRAVGLKTGLYLSPWDRNNPTYGDSPRYNDLYAAQLTELLTRYGPIAEVWFDGANGEGPNGKRQVYDWPRVFGLVRQLQPNAVMFSDAGPDVRWCGNERGTAGDPNWSTVDPAIVTYPGASGPGIIESLQHGHPAGTVWRPAEVDVSIRPGWFHHPAEDERVRSVDNLVELYFTSVGRNGKLLLNVPPTREGLLHSTDVVRLAAWRVRLSSMFERDLAADAKRVGEMELDFGRDVTITVVRLEEDIARGQHVARYTLQGADGNGWRVLSAGTTIGYTKLDRIPATSVRRLRLTIDESVGQGGPVRMRVYGP